MLSLLAAAISARKDDPFPPSWRGDYSTLTVGWDNWGQEALGSRWLPQGESQLIQANPGGFADFWPAQAYFDRRVYCHGALWGGQSDPKSPLYRKPAVDLRSSRLPQISTSAMLPPREPSCRVIRSSYLGLVGLFGTRRGIRSPSAEQPLTFGAQSELLYVRNSSSFLLRAALPAAEASVGAGPFNPPERKAVNLRSGDE